MSLMVESFIHVSPNSPINTILNEKRSIKEIEKWWGIPFIVTDTVEDIGDPDYETLMDRLSEWSDIKINDRETWEAMVRVVS